MGKGKGSPEYFVAVVKPGRILFELDGVSIGNCKGSFKISFTKITN